MLTVLLVIYSKIDKPLQNSVNKQGVQIGLSEAFNYTLTVPNKPFSIFLYLIISYVFALALKLTAYEIAVFQFNTV